MAVNMTDDYDYHGFEIGLMQARKRCEEKAVTWFLENQDAIGHMCPPHWDR